MSRITMHPGCSYYADGVCNKCGWVDNDPSIRYVRCGLCGEVFEENCEYVDVEVGMVQGTPNYCWNCNASEQGYYKDDPKMEVRNGWWRPRPGWIDTPPGYVRLNECCLELVGGDQYYRKAGNWSVGFEIKDGRLFVVEAPNSPLAHTNGEEMFEVSREDWAASNG